MSDVQHCQRCKHTFPVEHFNGKKICQKCLAKQTRGSVARLQKIEEKKQNDAAADETYLTKEPVRARPKRTPLGARDVLVYRNADPNYEYHWFNDNKSGRPLSTVEDAGWEYVRDADPDCTGDRTVEGRRAPGGVVSKGVGGGATAYLMRKPKDEYDEDYAQTVLEPAMARENAILNADAEDSRFYTRKDVPIKVGTGLHGKQVKAIPT